MWLPDWLECADDNKLMKKLTYLIEFLFLSFHRASHYFRSFLYNFHYVPATAPLITATFFTKRQTLCFTAWEISPEISLSHIALCLATISIFSCSPVLTKLLIYMTFSVFLVGNLSYTLRLKMISYLAIYDFPSKIISYRKVGKRKFSPTKNQFLFFFNVYPSFSVIYILVLGAQNRLQTWTPRSAFFILGLRASGVNEILFLSISMGTCNQFLRRVHK